MNYLSSSAIFLKNVTNAEEELTGVRQGDGSLIQYEYDTYGNIAKMTYPDYPDGSTVSYSYDDLDRLISVTDVSGKKTTYSYNEAGDLTAGRQAGRWK